MAKLWGIMDINKLWKTVKTLESTDFETVFHPHFFEVSNISFCGK